MTTDKVKEVQDYLRNKGIDIQKQCPKFRIEKYHRPFLADQGSGCRMVQYEVTRIERPNVKGYGMSESDAICNLICEVQPL